MTCTEGVGLVHISNAPIQLLLHQCIISSVGMIRRHCMKRVSGLICQGDLKACSGDLRIQQRILTNLC